MGKRREVPEGMETSATAVVVGVLQQQRPSRFAPLEQHNVNRVVLEVGDLDFPILAHRGLADDLSGMEAGWVIRAEGKLKQNRWSTCDGRQRLEVVLEAEKIERL